MRKSKRHLVIILIIIIYVLVAFLIINNSRKIDINSCSQEALESLPSIGEVISQRIVDNRPYEDVYELLSIEGIGEKRFNKIKYLVVTK